MPFAGADPRRDRAQLRPAAPPRCGDHPLADDRRDGRSPDRASVSRPRSSRRAAGRASHVGSVDAPVSVTRRRLQSRQPPQRAAPRRHAADRPGHRARRGRRRAHRPRPRLLGRLRRVAAFGVQPVGRWPLAARRRARRDRVGRIHRAADRGSRRGAGQTPRPCLFFWRSASGSSLSCWVAAVRACRSTVRGRWRFWATDRGSAPTLRCRRIRHRSMRGCGC